MVLSENEEEACVEEPRMYTKESQLGWHRNHRASNKGLYRNGGSNRG
jgi:hypothetical protein